MFLWYKIIVQRLRDNVSELASTKILQEREITIITFI